MSRVIVPRSDVSPAEYLEWERAQPGRHQLLRGAVYAMAGESPRHNLLGARLLEQLGAALRGSPCRPFSSDQRIHNPATGDYVYADAIVICGPVHLHGDTRDVIDNPSVVVEVLSNSTEQHDRGDKWEGYRGLASLTDYLLVSQRLARLEHFAREEDGSWRYRVVGAGGRLVLATRAEFMVDGLYDGVFDVPGDD